MLLMTEIRRFQTSWATGSLSLLFSGFFYTSQGGDRRISPSTGGRYLIGPRVVRISSSSCSLGFSSVESPEFNVTQPFGNAPLNLYYTTGMNQLGFYARDCPIPIPPLWILVARIRFAKKRMDTMFRTKETTMWTYIQRRKGIFLGFSSWLHLFFSHFAVLDGFFSRPSGRLFSHQFVSQGLGLRAMCFLWTTLWRLCRGPSGDFQSVVFAFVIFVAFGSWFGALGGIPHPVHFLWRAPPPPKKKKAFTNSTVSGPGIPPSFGLLMFDIYFFCQFVFK